MDCHQGDKNHPRLPLVLNILLGTILYIYVLRDVKLSLKGCYGNLGVYQIRETHRRQTNVKMRERTRKRTYWRITFSMEVFVHGRKDSCV